MKSSVYTPESSIRSPSKMIKNMKDDLLRSRGLAWRLALRDTQAQYRQSYFGYIWAFMLPVVNSVTWIFLHSTGIITLTSTGIPYPVYVFTGTMLWQIFSESLQSPLIEVGAAKSMLTKLNFPHEALILSGIYKTLLNAVIKILILIPAIMIMGVRQDWHLVLFPIGILSIVLVGNTLGLLLSPLGVLYTDIGKAIPLISQFLMFVTPVVFAMPADGFTARLFELNFMTPMIMTTRDWLTGNATEWLGYFISVDVIALILLMVGWIIYRVTMPILIERMSA